MFTILEVRILYYMVVVVLKDEEVVSSGVVEGLEVEKYLSKLGSY